MRVKMAQYMNNLLPLDCDGSPICGVRLAAQQFYHSIPQYLQQYINENNVSSWHQITNQIDAIYHSLDNVLFPLNQETHFIKEIKSQITSSKKLFFKLNLVLPLTIDPITHGAGSHLILTTEWPFLAATMRWFHDHLHLHYYQMAAGDASTTTFLFSTQLTSSSQYSITSEALIEGKSTDFYGGWGFYFVRQYLMDRHPAFHTDSPMNGYEESVAGTFLPPGKAGNKLMLYDLNKITSSSGRTVSVPDSENFSEITLHKVIIGGNPGDAEDIKDYPGCILINLPKPKLHEEDLLTNAVKNLGIGLYPSQCADSHMTLNQYNWKYAYPSTENPSLKSKLPHSNWIFEIDEATALPKKDASGHYIATHTNGLIGTQLDILSVLKAQKVYTLHLMDAIYIINLSHMDEHAVRAPEGYIWCSLDPVALDLFTARYCFNTLPMSQSLKLKERYCWPTEFVHEIPIPTLESGRIKSTSGYDSPLFRYPLFDSAEKKGLGLTHYHIRGYDNLTRCPLVSISGHLGYLKRSQFTEHLTQTLYYNRTSFLHHLQKTCLNYAKCYDKLASTSLYEELMTLFDENKDGVIDYTETGRGINTANYVMQAALFNLPLSEPHGDLKRNFLSACFYTKFAHPKWNAEAHDFTREWYLVSLLRLAFQLSLQDHCTPDPFIPHMIYGNGYWPSLLTVSQLQLMTSLYGTSAFSDIQLTSMYGNAFQYADIILNNGLYTQSITPTKNILSPLNTYFDAITKGSLPLCFTVYVPTGYGYLEGNPVPNVEETEYPAKIFTAVFNDTLHDKIIVWTF